MHNTFFMMCSCIGTGFLEMMLHRLFPELAKKMEPAMDGKDHVMQKLKEGRLPWGRTN